MSRRLSSKSIVVAALALTPALAAAPPQTTDVLAAYAIDSDTNALVRYAFVDDTFLTIGVVRTASGTVVEDMEGLTYVPAGPGKGMYAVPTKAPYVRKLVRIDPLTAEATVFAPFVVPAGRKITGMISNQDPVTGEWYILAASSEDKVSSKTAFETRELVRINPVTGTSAIAASQAQLGNGLRFEGLGLDTDGDLWAVSRTRLFRIHQEAGYWVQDIGLTGLDKAEGFEIAFGDTQPPIDVPGVNPSWTQDGVFFVADDNLQKFGVLNPATGQFVEYLVNGGPSAFITKDPEGMVILTLSRDPLYGQFVTFD